MRVILITPPHPRPDPSPKVPSRRRKVLYIISRLLEGDEPGGGGTETGTTVSDGLVGDGELSEVVAGHLGLDLNGGERLSVLRRSDTKAHQPDRPRYITL